MVSGFANGQLHIHNLQYRNKIEDATIYFKDTVKNHSSVLPLINSGFFKQNRRGSLHLDRSSVYQKRKPYTLTAYPIADLTVGSETRGTDEIGSIFNAGIGAGIDYQSKKLYITGKFMPYAASSGVIRDSVQQNYTMDIGGSRSIFNNGYQQNEFLLAYRPNRFFTFMTGNGRNTFGEGYRSLILSDNAAPNPFFKIETSFANVKYVNLYQKWKNNTIDPSNRNLDQNKFAAMHYISWNITREFNLSVFETVVWQANDTLVNRGFDPNYLNPIVFYRPVEYGNGSADNVLLGANMSFKFDDKRALYTQLILDDFLLAEIRARSRWWANKYGVQLGYKSREFLGKEDLYFQAEFNVVRPFTFSHKTAAPSYGHLNASVTHPIGANFYEALNIISYQTEKFRFTNKITYSSYGVDTSGTSYGQDIFAPYNNRDGDYDHFIMQGLKKVVINETFIAETPLIKDIDLYFNVTYNWRREFSEFGTRSNHSILIGIRSRIWNRYTDL